MADVYKTRSERESFDWGEYFDNRKTSFDFDESDCVNIVKQIREHLREDGFEISLTLTKVMRSLLKNICLRKDVNILELGAATGFLTRWLLDEYGGMGTLVDNNQRSYEAFLRLGAQDHYQISYVQDDIFKTDFSRSFDIVCSFGLVEHFADKQAVLQAHAKYVKPEGYIIILMPMDTRLSRVYWEVHQELNMGYRELLTESAFKKMFQEIDGLELISTEVSSGYVYDFIAGIAQYSRGEL